MTNPAPKSFLARNRFLIARRLSQMTVLFLFLAGPLFGIWILKGNYSGSLFLDAVPLGDPLLLAQSLLTGHWPAATALVGALLALLLWAILGGRSYCSWVCPFNPITDLAFWLRVKLGITDSAPLSASLRYFVLGAALLGAALTGTLVWEWFNPISATGRGLIGASEKIALGVGVGQAILFAFGSSLWLIAAIFLLDLLVVKHGWCGHICPVGALYGLAGRRSMVSISAKNRERCDRCMICIKACPEPQVLPRPLFGEKESPLVKSGDCTRCGRCVDLCPENVFAPVLSLPGRDFGGKKN